MKDYKRLTERRGGFLIDNCANCPNVNNPQGCTAKKCYEIDKNRLADLEDKIENGEFCDREEVRKETAREILTRLYELTQRHYGNKYLLSSKNVIELANEYNVNLEDEE